MLGYCYLSYIKIYFYINTRCGYTYKEVLHDFLSSLQFLVVNNKVSILLNNIIINIGIVDKHKQM
jgi:hypothetical protein